MGAPVGCVCRRGSSAPRATAESGTGLRTPPSRVLAAPGERGRDNLSVQRHTARGFPSLNYPIPSYPQQFKCPQGPRGLALGARRRPPALEVPLLSEPRLLGDASMDCRAWVSSFNASRRRRLKCIVLSFPNRVQQQGQGKVLCDHRVILEEPLPSPREIGPPSAPSPSPGAAVGSGRLSGKPNGQAVTGQRAPCRVPPPPGAGHLDRPYEEVTDVREAPRWRLAVLRPLRPPPCQTWVTSLGPGWATRSLVTRRRGTTG